jgi:hypothetical protein
MISVEDHCKRKGCLPMSWFKKKRSLRISPILFADLLYQNWVDEDNPQAAPQKYHLPEAVHERFRQKVFLYREANVLLALWIWAKQDPLFEQPLHEYERILFPQSPGTPDAAARLLAVRAAGGDLDDLVELGRKGSGQLAWARKWFADMDHEETNPITLAQLSNFLLHIHIGVQKTLKAFHDDRR